jgi:ribosomal protein S18 acetylase RimI-like enzyme
MLRWAQEHVAAHAYLQVMNSNAPARHLYAKLGFLEIYQYWCRVPDV